MKTTLRSVVLPLFLAFSSGSLAVFGLSAAEPSAADPAPASPWIVPPADQLDHAAFAQWVDGAESAAALEPNRVSVGAGVVLWTDKGGPIHSGLAFGATTSPGPRHLRIAFRRPIRIASLLVRGGGRLSVLKTDAPYPGDMADDRHWLDAERQGVGGPTRQEAGRDDYAVWLLPAPLDIRALRFTHDALATDKSYAGWLGGAAFFGTRLANVAPQATASSNLDVGHPEHLLDGRQAPAWQRFDSYDKSPTRPEQQVSESNPSLVTLVWPRPVALRGLAALAIGAATADVQVYAGPAERHPRDARDADWRTVRRFEPLDPEYPRTLPLRWLDFGQSLTARAVRLRIVRPVDGKKLHPHLHSSDQEGRRVWIGELMALAELGERPLAALAAPPSEPTHPPIPIHFQLAEPGRVSLVIEDANRRRVRNLIAETPFPAGKNTVWWDGLDDLGRDPDAAKHGLYNVPGAPVAPGDYQVRGVWHKAIDLRYEFSIYTAGNPAWNTENKRGAWLANHSPPQAALFVPASHGPAGVAAVYLGSFVSEGTHGLAWVDLEGRKLGGVNWIGGHWTGAPFLAGDDSNQAVAGVHAYVGSVWPIDKKSPDLELRLTAMTSQGERPVVRHRLPGLAAEKKQGDDDGSQLGGLAARAGWLFAALPLQNKIVSVDARSTTAATSDKQPSGSLVGEHAVANARGLAFDRDGRLLVVSGRTVRRYLVGDLAIRPSLDEGQALIETGLDAPQQIVVDSRGRIYVSDHGQSHQVKVFDDQGRPLRTIGKAGVPAAGPYDPLQMRRPFGLTIDERDRLWVAEHSQQPKRVSVWRIDGQFERAFYGPSEYGGGGTLDPHDAGQFHYHGMTFRLDWKQGGFQLVRIYYPGVDPQPLAFRSNYPETPLYRDGRRYWTNAFNSSPTGGHGSAFVFVERDGVAVAAAGCGRAENWDTLKTDAFRDLWPAPANPRGDRFQQNATFLWNDLDGDGHAQPREVTIVAGPCGGVTVMSDLAFVISRLNGKTVRLPVERFTDNADNAGPKIPIYDLAKAETLADAVQAPKSSGGDQALVHRDGWTVVTLGVGPFSPYSISGLYRGEPRWSYPNVWPGLHASHEAAVPDRPGMLVGPTRLLGGWIEPKNSDVDPLWFVNANMGTIYVFTADGLLVRTLFQDSRIGKPWAMPRAERGMLLNELTLHDENFWPTVSQTPAGDVFLQDGGRSSLVRVEGLETLRRLPPQTIRIGEKELRAAWQWRLEAEARRRDEQGTGTLAVALRPQAPIVDGRLDDWTAAEWATIDKRGTKANFNSNSKPYDISAALAIADGRLYAAYRTGDPDLLKNSGEQPTAPFKTGGALDLMLGVDPAADPQRTAPAAGDLRLLVTRIDDPARKAPPRIRAIVYRAVVPGAAPQDRTPFSSPWRTIQFDRVDDVSDQVTLAGANGDFEFSIPLSTLGLNMSAGQSLKGDLGVLRGNGFQTHHRVYWTNKATAITADVPSEAELTPRLWGLFRFQ